ncbi:glycoside hydrolase family 2 protein [Chryseolinea lacunae]|uniref:Beta galactosidase jelly roll domain-containing protein n=1 Tax=Chryseolinea lacunae TaxID=2801331 RepID=A0ABS1KUF9_9BACT|nr:glycoside hydrolase family 2 TIM barrel-domain containing protein [Chryseolinea lacunae]MBL0743110.1 beta galactosidase jelly roll domain-containing protein [Chryseolinea lacunae]
MKVNYLFLILFLLPFGIQAQASKTPLHGEWAFALDPVNIGDREDWYKPTFPSNRWDKVTVPHCFSVDPRYSLYTGTAWYIKKFKQTKLPAGHRAFLRFEAVFYKAGIWVNGKKLGEHEGGYTPFEIDVTEALSEENTLALRVNNAWDTTTIPGAKTRVNFENENSAQVFPWINYGGINREVYLIVRPTTFIQRVKIVADPDLIKKTASIQVRVDVANADASKPAPALTIYNNKTKIPVKWKSKPGTTGSYTLEGTLAAKDVKLWNQDEPVLYDAEVVAGADTLRTKFGIRKVEVKGTSLLLNGEPIRMGGCNRPLDYPKYGSMDPAIVLEQDLNLIKAGSMELSRISHYPVSTQLLDWADAHGLLIIAEAGNWQLTPKQMADPVMRKKFQSQFSEMVERDWNHPSVIAWSVGNEYQSQTPEGQTWTKDMYAYAKQLDPSRLVTFASMMVWRENIKTAEGEASQYVDFISANMYGNYLANLKHIHELYPNKAVYVSEFGIRTDGVKNEQGRVDHLVKAMQDFRQCDFVVGASVWTFNDYQSRFPGTNANGYRPWGLVSPERELRDMYFTWQEEFSPATLSVTRTGNKLSVTVSARKDLPSYTLRNYKLLCGNQTFDIAQLKPGESKTFECEGSATQLSLVKPGGFTVLKKSIGQ